MPLKGIFFDAADTLFRVRGGVGFVYAESARRYGIAAQPDLLDQTFARVFASSPPLAFPHCSLAEIQNLEKKWWHDLVRQVFSEVGPFARFEEFFEELFEVFRGEQGWELFPETEGVLSTLRKWGLTIGIISNFDSRLFDLLENLKIAPYIDSATISSYEGVAKPDRGLFRRALAKHTFSPGDVLYVGDSLREDVEGARSCGIRSVLVDRRGEYAGRTDLIRVEGLTGVLEFTGPTSKETVGGRGGEHGWVACGQEPPTKKR